MFCRKEIQSAKSLPQLFQNENIDENSLFSSNKSKFFDSKVFYTQNLKDSKKTSKNMIFKKNDHSQNVFQQINNHENSDMKDRKLYSK